MKIEFEKLYIKDFKGIKELSIEFGKSQTVIQGANETGKTTVADAIAYVLTGKNSLGESTFDVLPIGKENVSSFVTLDLTMDDGTREKPVTLTRSYQAKTNKNKEFTGEYQTLCEINGIKTGPRDFDKWIADNICKPEIFRLIHDVRYFTENIQGNGKERAWEAQRRLIMSICDVEDDYTYAKSKEAYESLLDGLGRYDSASEYLVYLKSKEKNYEQQISDANARIQFLSEKANEYNGDRTLKDIQSEMESLNKELKKVSESISKDIEAKKKKIQLAYDKEKQKFEERRKSENEKARNDFATRKSLEDDKRRLQMQIISLESKIKNFKEADICMNCGQKLPPELIEKNKNEKRNCEELIKAYTSDIALLDEELDKIPNGYPEIEYPKKLEELTLAMAEVSKKENYKEKYDKMDELTDRLNSLREEEYKAKKKESFLNEIEENEKYNEAALDDRAKIRYLIDVCSLFIQEKCKAVTEQINGMFDGVTFKMFRFNKTNDEMKECCDIFFNGVPYQSLSYSTKFYVSLKIALGFQKHFNVSMPIVIDNAESIDLNEKIDVQTIALKKEEEWCPKCETGRTGRKGTDGYWTCSTCGHKFIKTLEINTI